MGAMDVSPWTPPDRKVIQRLKVLKRGLPRRRPPRLRPPVKPTSLGRWVRNRLLILVATLLLFWLVLPPFYWPVHAPVSSGFLFRWKPDSSTPSLEIHKGIDLAAPRGSSVSVSGLGVVDAVGRTADLGNFVRVTHLFGIQTLYGHLERTDVTPGGDVGITSGAARVLDPNRTRCDAAEQKLVVHISAEPEQLLIDPASPFARFRPGRNR